MKLVHRRKNHMKLYDKYALMIKISRQIIIASQGNVTIDKIIASIKYDLTVRSH